MTVADEFRAILTRETSLSRHVVETATFAELARLMYEELGEQRATDLGWWHVVDAYVRELQREQAAA